MHVRPRQHARYFGYAQQRTYDKQRTKRKRKDTKVENYTSTPKKHDHAGSQPDADKLA